MLFLDMNVLQIGYSHLFCAQSHRYIILIISPQESGEWLSFWLPQFSEFLGI